MRLRIAVLLGAAVLAGAVVPLFAGGTDLDRTALALALAGLGAGTALALGAGRPLLVTAALSGTGAYVSALASLHQVPVPLAVLCGCAAGACVGAMVALVGARLDPPAFLLATMLVAVAGGALVQATPEITGAESGLGPIPPLSIPAGGSRSVVLTPVGDFQLMLGVAVLLTAIAIVLVQKGPGPRWRAIGSDRMRAADTGLLPLAGEISVLVVCGAFAGVSGALAAHVSQSATPSAFALDVGALPLLAALTADRDPFGAAIVAVATGILAFVALPSLGWQGPISAQSLSLVVLAVVALGALWLRRRRSRGALVTAQIDPEGAWPVAGLNLRGTELSVPATLLRSPGGATLVDSPAFSVPPGTIHAVVGPNGSGKTTLLRAVASRAHRRPGSPARLALLPQAGGGFDACTVAETLHLAAARSRPRRAAESISQAWLQRLALVSAASRRCSELSGGQRRLLDLARVLLGAPTVLLCDEPLAGLDDRQRAAAIGCLVAAADCGLTIVIAEHDREAVARLASTTTELTRAPATSPAAASLSPAAR